MKAFSLFAVLLGLALGPVWAGEPLPIFEAGPGAAAPAPTQLDHWVSARLHQGGIPEANLCSDAVFLRRVYLDVIGTLPTAQEAQAA